MKRRMIVSGFLMILGLALTGCATNTYVSVGPKWDALHNLETPENTFDVSVKGDGKAAVGEELAFKVKSEKQGRLWVVQVDPDDHRTVLFPNDMASDNRIPAGETVYIPPKGAGWTIEATEPAGRSVIAFIVTTGDLDLYDVMGPGGNTEKSLRLARKPDGWALDKLVVNIVK